MNSQNLEYLVARAERERAIGMTCQDNAAALAHLRMADEYERRAKILRGIENAPGSFTNQR